MLCIFFKYIILMPLLDFISLMQLPCIVALVECWTCKWYFALSLLACMPECSFLVWMSIVVTIYSDCSFWSSHCLLLNSILFDRIVLAPYALQVFCIQWSYCVVVFSRDTCSYGSRVSQILELGVREFCSTVPNSHVKSRVCFRVLSWNSQRGRL